TVFQRALRAAKRARDETGLGRGKLSVASIAVDVARDVFDHFDDKTILVIGAGKMGELALQHLRALRPSAILVANRDPARAHSAPRSNATLRTAVSSLTGPERSSSARRRPARPPCDTGKPPGPCSASSAIAPKPSFVASSTGSSPPGPT